MEKSSLKLAVIGAGHFGRFHALKAAQHRSETLIGLYDTIEERACKLAKECKTEIFPSYDAVLNHPLIDAVIIATPAPTHYILAKRALLANKHVLIEKPISETIKDARELIALAKEKKRILQVGHLLRYSAEHNAIKNRIMFPLYIEATRIAPYQERGTDVSVILDLMIHDLDFILSLVESPILSIDALGAHVSSPYEDIANARIRFENGCVATITASRISLKKERHMRIFSKEGYLSANFMKKELSFINKEKGLPLLGTHGFKRESLTWKDHDNLLAEHDAFIASCLKNAPVLVDGEAALRALEAALKIADSMRYSKEMMIESGLLPSL